MLKHKDKLLQAIASDLAGARVERVSVVNLEVIFYCDGDGAEYIFSLAAALDVLANDLYWDERGDWRNADHAVVRSL